MMNTDNLFLIYFVRYNVSLVPQPMRDDSPNAALAEDVGNSISDVTSDQSPEWR